MFVILVLQVKLIENFSEGSAGAMSISDSRVVINGADNFVQNNTGADSSGAFSVEVASQLEMQGSMCATGNRAGTGGGFAGIVQADSPGASLAMAAGSNVKLADNTSSAINMLYNVRVLCGVAAQTWNYSADAHQGLSYNITGDACGCNEAIVNGSSKVCEQCGAAGWNQATFDCVSCMMHHHSSVH